MASTSGCELQAPLVRPGSSVRRLGRRGLRNSRAKIEPGHKIHFRYRGKHGWCEMIYERRVAELGKTFLG